eukprot:TRINITY_DN5308_c0_g6_i2.p1 TRINITY_DN5308_c0_g6~~TRINITY_DN5308_c0_g6_i2.p1  ORF type:complete len:340 (-),score=102.23 TRINITY_DN5308_c0_g6_i2:226-1245(-)
MSDAGTSPKSSRKKSRVFENQSTLTDFFISTKKPKKESEERKSPAKEVTIPQEVKEDEIKQQVHELIKSVSKEKKEEAKESKDNAEDKKTSENEGNEEKVEAEDSFPSYDDWLSDLGDWKQPLKEFLATGKLKKIYEAVKKECKSHTVYPPPHLVFNAFKNTSFANVKAVIVGQDPYIKENQAMGLCFSVPRGTSVPGSLRNIYAALANDAKVSFTWPKPLHGDLSRWAAQGVLLINSVLTVEAGKSNSHKALGWSEFTDEVIKAIGNKKKEVVFLLWGKFAQAKKKFVNQGNHKVLEYCHPWRLAASAKNNFKKCLHFSQTNEYLAEKGKEGIDWNVG